MSKTRGGDVRQATRKSGNVVSQRGKKAKECEGTCKEERNDENAENDKNSTENCEISDVKERA